MKNKILLLSAALLMCAAAYAQLATPPVLSSNMVLQQGCKVPIWGDAEPNERITVTFGKQQVKGKADAAGKWLVELQPMPADKNPQALTIKGKKTSIVYDNVLVGEVWLCSGQSNMQYTMQLRGNYALPKRGADSAKLELEKPANSMMRVLNCARGKAAVSWRVADGETLVTTSAPGYFFGKAIREKLDVPVGIITSAIGGTQIEAWTTMAAYEKSPTFAPMLKSGSGKIDGHAPESCYKTMIEPLVPYAVKGFLWYQGENNCGKSDRMYAEKFRVMVESWRDVFRAPNAPFYSVLLAPHIYSDRMHRNGRRPVTAEELPLFWAQQVQAAAAVPNSDYAVITDLVDDLKDIHPSYKWEVGRRLARLALAKDYGFANIAWSGPRIRATETLADSIVVSFDHVADSLRTNDRRRVTWFEVAASDGIFRPAIADIKGKDKVVVYHPDIKQPTKVRFGWHETAMPNLVNSEGLPATPFTR